MARPGKAPSGRGRLGRTPSTMAETTGLPKAQTRPRGGPSTLAVVRTDAGEGEGGWDGGGSAVSGGSGGSGGQEAAGHASEAEGGWTG